MSGVRPADTRRAEPASGAFVRFLVDAHLPPSLAALLAGHGHDALHTGNLPAKNETRDGEINELSLREERVVITKDTVFSTHTSCKGDRGSCCW